MATLTTITNISNQVIPVLVESIDSDIASDSSDVDASLSRQVQIAAGAQLRVETARVDLAQLDRLRSYRLISYQ